MSLRQAEIEVAIAYNQEHAMDVLPGIERALGRQPSRPGRGRWMDEEVAHVAELQRKAGLTVDGQFGPGSRLQLCGELQCYEASVLWPAIGVEERNHWLWLCETLGHPLDEARHTLIALRCLSLDAVCTHPSASRPAYDDTFVWLGADGDVRRFAGATHSYQARSDNMGDDIDGDGRHDISTIRPGRYIGTKAHRFCGHVALDLYNLEGTNHIPTWRDVDGDRGISATDRQVSMQPSHGVQVDEDGAYARGIKFHPGYDCEKNDGSGRRFSSVGCQTARLEDIEHLHAAREFDYILLDAVEALDALGVLEPPRAYSQGE
jgi:hypothetical protein